MSADLEKLLAEIRGAVARGWCAEVNAKKEFDADLAEAIVAQIYAMPVFAAPDLARQVIALTAENAALRAKAEKLEEALKSAAWIACAVDVHRYLIANVQGASAKAIHHIEIATKMTAILLGKDIDDRDDYFSEIKRVHDTTQAVTDHLDRYGFVFDKPNDLETLSPKVFSAMWEIASAALTEWGTP